MFALGGILLIIGNVIESSTFGSRLHWITIDNPNQSIGMIVVVAGIVMIIGAIIPLILEKYTTE
jgi:hypothetical protein|tara:strand:+ start:458 stop:649 length:192 start_codon:yes stop_codon:yes gene_type:complete